MGRVYNALVKVERERGVAPAAERYGRRDNPLRSALAAELSESAKTQIKQFGAPSNDSTSQAFNLANGRSASPLNPVAGSESGETVTIAQEPARHLRVAPPAPPAPVFGEARQSASISALTVDPHLAAVTGSDELASERYRTLAVRLLNLSARRELKSLLISSAHQGEGKTTVATNLAWVMAKRGERRVLLIDADLRCPSVALALGMTTSCGWLDVVEGSTEIGDAVIRLDPNGLYVLTPRASLAAGREHEGCATVDTITSSRVEKMIRELEQHFDFIIVDAPPIIEFADAQRLASITDGTAIVTRAGHTHHTAVTEALKLVPKERRVGVVLNEAKVDEEVAYHKRKANRLFGTGS